MHLDLSEAVNMSLHFTETKEFVDRLFVALDNDSYITAETKPPKPVPPVVPAIALLESLAREPEKNNTPPGTQQVEPDNLNSKDKVCIFRFQTFDFIFVTNRIMKTMI